MARISVVAKGNDALAASAHHLAVAKEKAVEHIQRCYQVIIDQFDIERRGTFKVIYFVLNLKAEEPSARMLGKQREVANH